MNLATQRRIDRYLGIPVCMVLTGIVRLLEAVGPQRRRVGPRKVLFIELSEMGSTILASAAIRRLQALYHERSHCFVIFERNAASLRLLGLFDERDIFTMRDDSLAHLAVDLWRFVRFCRAQGVDTVIDLELFSRVSSILSLLSGARERVGFHNYRGEGLYRGEHLTHRVHYNPYNHMAQNFMALVEALEGNPDDVPQPKTVIPVQPPPVTIGVDLEAFAYVQRELLARYPLEPRHRVVVVNHHAGNLLPLRMWPVERFVALVQRLLADPDVVVVLMGIAEGAESARHIARSVGDPRCIDFVGRTRTLTDVIQLFLQSDLVITNDSGPAHFATLTPVRSITLFGPETPVLYGTLGPNAVHLYAGLACSPCLSALNHRNSPCMDNRCLQAIAVDEVVEHARRLLGEPSTRMAEVTHPMDASADRR